MTRYQELAGRIKIAESEPEKFGSGEMYYNSTKEVFVRTNGSSELGISMTTSTSTSTSTTTS